VYLALTLAVLFAARLFTLLFIADWKNSQVSELGALFLTGLRFDLKFTALALIVLVLLPLLLFSLINRWRWLCHWFRHSLFALLLSTTILSFLDVGFYFYFGTEISGLIFGLINDGFYEVMVSVLADWRLDIIILASIICCAGLSRVFLKLSATSDIQARSATPKWKVFSVVFCLIITCALFGRGSFDTFPLSRKTTIVSDNSLLNSLAMNSPYHLYYMLRDKGKDRLNNLSPEAILSAVKVNSREELELSAGYTKQNPLMLATSNKGETFKKPNVIFVLMEGWSSHIALADSPANNVLGELTQHAQDDYFFTHFFSNRYGTNPTIESLLLNSPITPLSQSSANTHSFAISNVLPFKRQGYESQFLSGGNSSWRNHGKFWLQQGFDQYIGRATIERYFNTESDNPWGVYETYLFQYLQKQLQEKSTGTPLFSFLLTTNNHGPIRLPADYVAPPLSPARYGYKATDAKIHESLTGYHYQSDALGKFMTWLKQSKFAVNTIVVATGDHVLKGFANYGSTTQLYNRYSVPAYFYIPPKYDQLNTVKKNQPGSHQDLFPTLFELALSEEQYFSFGSSLMHKSQEEAFGWIDQGGFIFDQGIATQSGKLYPWTDESHSSLSVEEQPLSQKNKRIIERQKYREALQKYMLLMDINQKLKKS